MENKRIRKRPRLAWDVAPTEPEASSRLPVVASEGTKTIRRASPPWREDDREGHYVFNFGDNLTPRYKIISKMGEGTFGRVLECWDREAHELVAIKVVRSIRKYRDAAMIEIDILQLLAKNDEGGLRCVQIRNWFDYRNHICIVFEKLGPSLFDFLRRNKYSAFPVDLVREFGRQLLESVAYMHDLRLIHTDLKPENILLVSSENVKLPNRKRSSQGEVLFRCLPKSSAIKLIDLGSTVPGDREYSCIASTRHYRAPEVILGMHQQATNDDDEQKEWYFFTPRVQLSENASRPCRLTGNVGFWKATSGIKDITRKSNKEVVGRNRKLVYYKGKHGNEQIKTDWIMNEFLLSDQLLQQITATTSRGAPSSSTKNTQLVELVLCKIYLNPQGRKKLSTQKVTTMIPTTSTNMLNGPSSTSLAVTEAFNYPEEPSLPSSEYPLHTNPLMDNQHLSMAYQDGMTSTLIQFGDFNHQQVLLDHHEYPPHQQQEVLKLHDPFPAADHRHYTQQQQQDNMEVDSQVDASHRQTEEQVVHNPFPADQYLSPQQQQNSSSQQPEEQDQDWDCFSIEELLGKESMLSSFPDSPMPPPNGDDQPFNTEYFPPEQQEQHQQYHFDHNNNLSTTEHETLARGELANHQQEQESPISPDLISPSPATTGYYFNGDQPFTVEYISSPATTGYYFNGDQLFTAEYISPQQPQHQQQEAHIANRDFRGDQLFII